MPDKVIITYDYHSPNELVTRVDEESLISNPDWNVCSSTWSRSCNKTGLELEKISKSPFGDYRRKNGRQIQKCSRQIEQEQKLKLGPHLIGIVFGLPVDFFRGCGTDQNTRYGRT